MITIASLILSTSAFSQEIKIVEKNEYKIGPLTVSDDRNDPEYSKYWSFRISFQNEEYDYIVDIGSIIFKDLESLQKLASLMQDMIDMPDKELVVDADIYTLNKYDFNNNVIYIRNNDGEYTLMNKKSIKELNELTATFELN
jgi:hypothetical protein